MDYLEHLDILQEQFPRIYFILESWQDVMATGMNYLDCKAMKTELEIHGWTVDYGLDAEPFDLHPIFDN